MLELLMTQAASFAKSVDSLITVIMLIVGIWFIIAEYVLFRFIRASRQRGRDGQKALYITGEQKSETKWIHIPHYLVILFDVFIIVCAIRVWSEVKQTLPPADETIRIIGHQWSWRFVHPGLDRQLGTADDVETVDELHVKVNRVYHFKLEGADVLHSFSVPSFRLKQDAIPGRVVTGWFKPNKLGQFDIQCAEMCGIGHGTMQSTLYIETDAEHEQWLKAYASGRI